MIREEEKTEELRTDQVVLQLPVWTPKDGPILSEEYNFLCNQKNQKQRHRDNYEMYIHKVS